MGVVYEVFDQERNETVALKTLRRDEPNAIYRFKREFRSLADAAHPNLVSLYELVVQDDNLFFTMEMVRGVDFLRYVRTRGPTLADQDRLLTLGPSSRFADVDETFQGVGSEGSRLETPEAMNPRLGHAPNLDTLVSTLKQLVAGLIALHGMGKLHRDIKPSNVLVTDGGRVVILDFGLITELSRIEQSETFDLVGTPAYMSPEQAMGHPVTEASDWYSVGVMLFESLTGEKPFKGTALEVLSQRQRLDPPSTSTFFPSVPPILVELTRRLMDPNPALRPNGRDILRALESLQAGESTERTPDDMPAEIPFVGRARHLELLREAFRDHSRGGTVTVCVHGESGMGKSALVGHFLDWLQIHSDAVVLRGRCYEQESVPYKALDGVVDSLSHYLVSLPQGSTEALMPRDVYCISRLFPVLKRVEAIRNAPRRAQEIPDPRELRRRAFLALRELLGRISDRKPLVVSIDDLQWADADSAILLDDLLRAPEAPAMMLIACFRSEDVAAKPFLQTLLQRTGKDSSRELVVGAMSRAEARKLVGYAWAQKVAPPPELIEVILAESEGSPLLVEQLARHSAAGDITLRGGKGLGEMLEALLRRLPAGSRELLGALAVAGQPVDSGVALRAARIDAGEHELLVELRATRLVRTRSSFRQLELYHDRIRETLLASLDAKEVALCHHRMARALEAAGLDDPDALFEHYLGAGEPELAAAQAERAGKKAVSALAFDRAASFFLRALDLASPDITDVTLLRVELADALANAGRPRDAALAYLAAAERSSPASALDCQRWAAEQFLLGGYVDEGLEVIGTILKGIGLTLPRTPVRALVSLYSRRLRLGLRGLEFTAVPVEDVSVDTIRRIDICWAVAAGLALVDPIRGAVFQTEHLLLALAAGERYRIARALAVEGGYAATPGGRARKRAARFREMAARLSEEVGVPHAAGITKMTAGIAAFLVGEWRESASQCKAAERILREECSRVPWELTNARIFHLGSLNYLGDIGEIGRRVPELLSEAREHGNLHAATELRTRMHVYWLAMDDPLTARGELEDAMGRWSQEGFHRQHYNAMLASAQIELYLGNAPAAWSSVVDAWPRLRRSLLPRIQVLRVEALLLRARCALALARGSNNRSNLLRHVDRLAKRIAKEGMAWSAAFAPMLRAGVAWLRGNETESIANLRASIVGFEAAEMHLFANASRLRLGSLLGGDEGRRWMNQAEDYMARERIANSRRMVQMMVPCPGSWE